MLNNEAGFPQQPEMARHDGTAEPQPSCDQRRAPRTQCDRADDPAPGRVGQECDAGTTSSRHSRRVARGSYRPVIRPLPAIVARSGKDLGSDVLEGALSDADATRDARDATTTADVGSRMAPLATPRVAGRGHEG